MATDSQAYMYQLTINDPVPKGFSHVEIISIFRKNFKTLSYVAMADEQGSCHHTHIFCVFSSRVRFSMVKKHFPEAHVEKCKGSISENINYIKKSGKWVSDDLKQETVIEGTFEEYGTPPPDSRGKRHDLTELYQMVADGLTNAEILAANQDYILCVEKIDKIRMILLTEKYKDTVRLDLRVVYVYGSTGTGKTRGVLQQNGYTQVYRVTDYQHPFDNYNGQPVLAFDEFRSSLSIKDMLNYCDIYPLELPGRYNNKFACYSKVYIISNWPLERQYEHIQADDPETWKAFLRRIHEVHVYKGDGRIEKYGSVDEYMQNGFAEIEDNDGDISF